MEEWYIYRSIDIEELTTIVTTINPISLAIAFPILAISMAMTAMCMAGRRTFPIH